MATTYQRFNLLIDSGKRTNKNETNTDFSVNLTNGYKVKMARLKSACIPLTFYNITNNNNSFSYSVYGNAGYTHTYTVSIVAGRYNAEDIVTSVNNKLTAFAPDPVGNLQIQFDNTTGLFTFVYTVNPGDIALYINNSPFLNYIGFTPTQLTNTYQSSHLYIYPLNLPLLLTATNPPSFINTNYLKLTLNYLGSNLLSIDNNQNNTTFFLELDTDYQNDYFGKKLLIQNPADDTGCKNNIYDVPINLQNFKITLTDRNDNILDLNGVDWWCMIEIITEVPVASIIATELSQFIPPNNPNIPSYMIPSQPPVQQKKSNLPLWMRV